MKRKVVGVARPLNEIAQELIQQGFDVTDLQENNKGLDALVYYDQMINEGFKNMTSNDQILRINAAEHNIDQIVEKIKEI
ncbi:YkuS family protein [Marinisporobacter balticus]|uniref:Uncharacterized protein UPF0180 n=1 Tax=Marinisporobacter balticus TaxID=2018667 RepID=A0A4R2KZS8_9FIRM|nr:YkuS family protein [Marinisporobacter balticus]TCO79453.1 uncharacterized protein UPF0180 [Marinisporobacter balticus]